MRTPPLRLSIKVIPRAKRNEVAGMREGELTVRLTAPPVEGAANEALLKFLAEALGLRRPDIALVSGERSRHKVIAVSGLSEAELSSRLAH